MTNLVHTAARPGERPEEDATRTHRPVPVRRSDGTERTARLPVGGGTRAFTGRLLIVDDQDEIRYLLRALLQAHGFEVDVAGNGVEALSVARRSPPALVLSDILMPQMDGYALCQAWRHDERLGDVPFVFYTATYMRAEDEQFAMRIGADRYLLKPLEPDELIAEIEGVLRDHRAGKLSRLRPPPLPSDDYESAHELAVSRKLQDKIDELDSVQSRLARVGRELRQSDERLRQAVRAGNIGLWDWDFRTDLIAYSPELENMFGYDPGEMGQAFTKWTDQLHPEDRPGVLEAVSRSTVRPWPEYHAEFRMRHKAGPWRWVLAHGGVLFNTRGEPVRMLGSLVDISERKQIESQQALNEKRLRSMLEISQSSADLSVRQILTFALEEAVRVTESHVGYVLDVDPTEKRVALGTWASGACTWCGGPGEPPLPPGAQPLWLECLETRAPVLQNGLNAQPIGSERRAHEAVERHLAVPVVDGGEVTLVLGVVNKEAPYDEADLRQLKLVGASLGRILREKHARTMLAETEQRFRGLVEQSIAGIYIVDPKGWLVYVNPCFEKIFGYESGELDGRRVWDLVLREDRAELARHIEAQSQSRSASFEHGFRGRRKDGAIIDLQTQATLATASGRPAIIGVLQDVTERRRADEQIGEYVHMIEAAMMSTVQAVTSMGELRDPYTAGHERRVAHLSKRIAAAMGLPPETVRGMEVIGLVHDVGKIALPSEILTKPSRLTAVEFELVKTHAALGAEIMKHAEFPWPVAQAIRQHHERLDGSGYPDGLHADAILLESRILGVADVVEAISSHRPYRPGLGIQAALQEIETKAGVLYDRDVVSTCLSLFREGYEFPAAGAPLVS